MFQVYLHHRPSFIRWTYILSVRQDLSWLLVEEEKIRMLVPVLNKLAERAWSQ